MYGWEGRHRGVGERVWERTESDHAEDFETVVLECEGQGFESFVFSYEAVDVC